MHVSVTMKSFLAMVTWTSTVIVVLLFATATFATEEDCGSDCTCGEAIIEPWTVLPKPWLDDCLISRYYDEAQRRKDEFIIPLGAGAFHWFQKDLDGNNSGYGIPGLRGTFFWYLTADPQTVLSNGWTVGAHTNIRLREQDRFRSFYDGQVWSYESYAYITIPEFGTLKGGQIVNRFGSDWGGVFWGTAGFFDGFKFNPDYGVSWEATPELTDGFKLDHYCQFFFHEDGINGSIPGADSESVAGYTAKNRGVVRLVPTWMHANGATTALGFSGLVGQIDSRRADAGDQVVSGWAIDVNHTVGPLRLIGETLQTYGVLNPVRYTSGGPSDRVTNLLGEAQYVTGPFTHRVSQSVSIADDPHGMLNMSVIGTRFAATKNVDVYMEYINQRIIQSADQTRNGQLFNGLSLIIHWRF